MLAALLRVGEPLVVVSASPDFRFGIIYSTYFGPIFGLHTREVGYLCNILEQNTPLESGIPAYQENSVA
eukprot:1987426-Pleurochrysis_carterae.AAC.1